MSVHNPHLRKALKLVQLSGQKLDTELRDDIRNALKVHSEEKSGGDFHVPFWADAKNFCFHDADLASLTQDRIESNPQRKRLYPLLQRSFEEWWTTFRAQRNEKMRPHKDHVKGDFIFDEVGVNVKIQNLICFSAGDSFHRFIYPYFSDEPVLTKEVASWGLAALKSTFPQYDDECFIILDVLRKQDYKLDKSDLHSNYIKAFESGYKRVLSRWDELRSEYR